MKAIRILIIPILIMLLGHLNGNAQTTYTFTYDASGNRLSRIIPLKSAKIENQDTQANQLKTFEDLIGNREVKIYPNPTKGLLRIQIPLTDETQVTLQVFTIRGALIKKIGVDNESTEIDLSSQPSGMYILKISVGDQTSEWKVIKE